MFFVFATNAQSKSLQVSFSIDEKNVENFDFFIFNDATNQLVQLSGLNGVFVISDSENKNNRYIISNSKHFIEIPKIDFLKEVNYIAVTYYNYSNKELYEKRYNMDFVKRKGKSYQVDFGLGDIYYVNFSKQKTKKLKKLLCGK